MTTGEECDDGNAIDGDGCDANCILEFCGNGVVQAGEQCDDGNANNGDGCTNTCETVSAASCTESCDTVGTEPAPFAVESKILASDGAAGDRFGVSASISGDTAIVGARKDDDLGNESGSAYVFRNGRWQLV